MSKSRSNRDSLARRPRAKDATKVQVDQSLLQSGLSSAKGQVTDLVKRSSETLLGKALQGDSSGVGKPKGHRSRTNKKSRGR